MQKQKCTGKCPVRSIQANATLSLKVNFEHIAQLCLVFSLLTLNK